MEHVSFWSMLMMLTCILGENINTVRKNRETLLEESEMGGACSVHVRDEKCMQHFYRKT